MRRVFRIALMWLVALAVPMQGVAAATMMACGPSHATAPQAQSGHGGSHHTQAEHAHDQHTAAHHDLADDDGNAVKTASQKCSVCASCCTAAMLPTPALAVAGSTLPEFVVPGVPADVAAFLTDGPERPPRILLD